LKLSAALGSRIKQVDRYLVHKRLRTTALFSEMSDDSLNAIAERLQPMEIRRGGLIFRAGAPGDAIFLIEDGEVSLTSQSVNGTLIDSATKQPITGKVVVALEQKDANGVDRVIMQDTPNALGQFVFCPVPAGTYEVVAVAVDSKGVGYAATIVTAVQPGNALGNVQMFAETASGTNVSTAPATVKGTITSTASNTPVPVDVVLDVLQNVTINGIQFLKQTGEGAATSNRWDWTGYSTMKNGACISLTFTLHSVVQGVVDPTPPAFDPTAESAVFSQIMSTYGNR
jgi:hypothetical protein